MTGVRDCQDGIANLSNIVYHKDRLVLVIVKWFASLRVLAPSFIIYSHPENPEAAMRNVTTIQSAELIIHILEPQGQGLIMSQAPLPLQEYPALNDYFSRHILNTLHDSAARAARFRNINPDQPSGVCRGLLRQELNLVDGSQRLAKVLYAAMEHDQRITAGDLIVCLFTTDAYPYTRFLAIMKVDPAQIFSHAVRQDSQGNTYVSFEPIKAAFTNERLQKCAVIQPLEPRHPEFDMLLVDRQSRLEAANVARFFSETFLDAQESYDPRKYTKTISKGLVNVQNSLRDQLTVEENTELEASIEHALSGRRLNLDTWLKELSLPAETKEKIEHHLPQDLPERSFNLDPQLSHQIVSQRKYRGDHGLRLDLPAGDYPDLTVEAEYIDDDPVRGPYYRIVIETKTWKRVV